MRQIHLSCQRPLIAANRGLFPKSAIFGNASNYLNNKFAQGKSQFSAAHPYLAIPCLTERMNVRDYIHCVPLNIADRGENRSGFPSNHENSQASARREFCEYEPPFVNIFYIEYSPERREVCAWHSATAKASAASSGRGMPFSRSKFAVTSWICFLSAPP